MTNLKNYLLLLRPHQWIKNAFILLPLFFGAKLTDTFALVKTAVAFGAFCATASAVYIFNDYMDMEADQKHPHNSERPLASGIVKTKSTLFLMVVLATVGIGVFFLFHTGVLAYLFCYIVLNVLYTLKLKHVPILDVVLISYGFVIRIFIGSIVSTVYLSMWIVIMTFLLALFLALAKRRSDVAIYAETGEKMRKTVDGYNMEFLNFSMVPSRTGISNTPWRGWTVSRWVIPSEEGSS